MKQFVVAEQARSHIRQIAAYCTGVRGSNRWFLDQVNTAIAHLMRFPGSGHRREDIGQTELRCWTMAPYLMIYRVEADTLVIVGVIHASRDLVKQMDGLND